MQRLVSLVLSLLLLVPTISVAQEKLFRFDMQTWKLQDAATANNAGTTILNVEGWGSAGVQVSGITDATVGIEATVDGTNWNALGCTKSNDGSLASTTTANLQWHCPIGNSKAIRAPITNYVSGTITVQVKRTTAPLGSGGGGGGGGGSITNILDGTGDSIMNSALNAAQVSCVAGCGGSGGTSMADDAAFTPAVTNVSPAGFMFDDVSPDVVNEGDGGIARMSANRNIYTTIRDAAGNERGVNVTAGNALTVDASATTQPISGTVTANAGTNLNTSALLTTAAHDAVFGTAGTADSQVMSVQGIASMTPLQVQSNSANLATETTLGSVLTSTNFAAAFGTAGAADSQVMSVQGVASMTPLQVQSNSANIATQTTAAAIQTAVEIIDNAISGSGVNISQINGVTPLMGAGNTGTGSPRVTIATDQAALTSFGARAEDSGHTTGDTGILGLAVRNDGGSPLCGTDLDYCPVTTDSSGALRVTGGGGGTEYTEDIATPAAIVGSAVMIERDDALSTVTPIEGDWLSLRGTSIGSLWVRDDNGGTVDSAAGATDRGMPMLAIRDDALTTLTPADGDYVNLRVDSIGSLHVTIDSIAATAASASVTEDGSIPADATGVSEVAAVLYCDNGTNPVHCDYTTAGGLKVNVAAQIPGTGATNLGKAVDSAAGATDTGVAILAVRDDSLSALTPVDGDYVHLRVNSTGALHVTGGGGGTQYNIGDVASATATGTMALAIRNDTLGTLADADGDVVGLRVNSQGALHVTGGGGGTEYVVNAAAPADPTGATFTMERDDALSTLTEIEGDWTNPRATAEGALWTQDFNSDAILAALNTVAGAVSGTEMQVDVLTLIPGVAATSLGKAEDAAHTTGDTGVAIWGIRDDTLGAFSGTEGDYEPFHMTAAGRLYTSATIDAALPAGTNNIGDVDIASIAAGDNNIGNVDIVTMPSVTIGTFPDNEPFNVAQYGGTAVVTGGTNGLVGVGGNVAHDAVDAANPVKIGGRAIAHGSNPTAVAAADRTDWYFSRAGIPFVMGGHPNVVTISAQVQDADGAQTDQAIASVTAGSKIVVTRLTASCDGSTTAPTNIRVGFGAANVPAAAHTGVAGILHEFDGVPAGGGFTIGDGSGILGVGADGEDLRYTMEDPAGGNCTVTASYYTIES